MAEEKEAADEVARGIDVVDEAAEGRKKGRPAENCFSAGLSCGW